MAAAFSFIIMMFNLPVPGGTTGHAVGSAVIAILFGPWAAMVAVSVALIIQALIFGDGGITAIGSNCFNMAVFMPFAAYYIFKLFSNNPVRKGKVFFAAFISGYLSLVMAAILTAIEFGIQPMIASSSDGKAIFCPYDLSIAIPAMAIEHLLLFGIVEGVITAFIVRYFLIHEPGLIYAFRKGSKIENE
jgi:cobalt/nickel transport system permease protein